MTKELAYRQNDGIDVTLLWHERRRQRRRVDPRREVRLRVRGRRAAGQGARRLLPPLRLRRLTSALHWRGLTGDRFRAASSRSSSWTSRTRRAWSTGSATSTSTSWRSTGAVIRAAVAEAGGHEVDCRADELFAAFDAPTSRRRRGHGAKALQGAEIAKARMGIHTGKPALSEANVLRRRRAPRGADLRCRSRRPDPRSPPTPRPR